MGRDDGTGFETPALLGTSVAKAPSAGQPRKGQPGFQCDAAPDERVPAGAVGTPQAAELGGASFVSYDAAMRHRTVAEIQTRGRWQTLKSVKN